MTDSMKLYWSPPVGKTIVGDTHATTTIDDLSATEILYCGVGMTITGTDVPAATTITVVGATSITISQAATGTTNDVTFTLGGYAWTQVTGIVSYPDINERMDNYGTCTVVVSDYEGAAFDSWHARDFVPVKIEDADSNILFQGYLKNRRFTRESITLALVGFAAVLDGTPFNKNYVLAEGKVKTVPGTTGLAASYDISADVQICAGLCSDGTNYYVVSYTDEKIVKYTKAFVWVAEYDISGDVGEPYGIAYNGTNFFVTSQGDDKVYEYNSAFALQGSYDLSGDVDELTLIAYLIGDFYVADLADHVFLYNSAFELQDEWDLSAYLSTNSGMTYRNGYFWITSLNDDKVFKFSTSFVYQDEYIDTSGEMAACYGFSWIDGCFLASSGAAEIIYRYLETGTYFSDDLSLALQQDDEDEGDPDFEWDPDRWIYPRDTGILIVDNSQGEYSKEWQCSALVSTNEYDEEGGVAGTITASDNIYYRFTTYNSTTAYVDFTMDTGVDLLTSKTLERIEIDFTMHCNYTPSSSLRIYLDKDGVYELHKAWFIGSFGPNTFSDTITLTEDLADYLDEAAGSYTGLKGLRITMVNGIFESPTVAVDYLKVKVFYTETAFSPIMEKIYDSGASWIVSYMDWTTSGVVAGDLFKIGENTASILGDIISTLDPALGITLEIKSTLSKYMARDFRGNKCVDALKAVKLLEGMFWKEDHTNKKIIISKEADFVDSGVDLTEADYEPGWEYEDDCNHFRQIDVYGNSSLNVCANATDTTSTSLMTKTIIDDTIMTNADAQEVADTQLAIWKDKNPSIFATLHGTNEDLEVMKLADITLARPTVAKTAYVIRRLNRVRVGEHVKTRIYCGLGSTPEDEKLANTIRDLQFLAQKSRTERLINTPLGCGASTTADQIGGLGIFVEDVITAELVNGQSIDNRIDALITADAATEHDRWISPISVVPDDLTTAGNNNVYWISTFATIGFGTTSLANSKCNVGFYLPSAYVADSNIVLKLPTFLVGGINGDQINYDCDLYETIDATASTLRNSQTSNFGAADHSANKINVEEITFDGTDLSAGNFITIQVRLQDNAAAKVVWGSNYQLKIRVTSRD